MTHFSTINEALDVVGGLSKPSKMPGYAYGIPAAACKTGAMLAKIPNTICSQCYALKGMYRFPVVKTAQQRRLEAIEDPRWEDAMVYLMKKKKIDYFRWHDSGDIQSVEHLFKIARIAAACPDTKFWIPTREKHFVSEFLRAGGVVPSNLVIRMSGTFIDKDESAMLSKFQNTSTVVTKNPTCPAPTQNNECGKCRACWDPSVVNVSYKQH